MFTSYDYILSCPVCQLGRDHKFCKKEGFHIENLNFLCCFAQCGTWNYRGFTGT